MRFDRTGNYITRAIKCHKSKHSHLKSAIFRARKLPKSSFHNKQRAPDDAFASIRPEIRSGISSSISSDSYSFGIDLPARVDELTIRRTAGRIRVSSSTEFVVEGIREPPDETGNAIDRALVYKPVAAPSNNLQGRRPVVDNSHLYQHFHTFC